MEKIDVLNRSEFVEQLVNLTINISANRASTCFALDGAWGCGKSFVLDMFQEKLKEVGDKENQQNRFFVIRYDSWKFDYYAEPLVAIVASLIDIIEKETALFPDSQENRELLGMLGKPDN